jgi:hypothetical protein
MTPLTPMKQKKISKGGESETWEEKKKKETAIEP